jgi:outer membrane protein, heavy metal efflux system
LKRGYCTKTALAVLLGIQGLGCQSVGDRAPSPSLSDLTTEQHASAPPPPLAAAPIARQLTDSVLPVQFQTEEELMPPSDLLQPGTIDPSPDLSTQVPKPVEHYVQLALANHPRIRAAQARVAAASQRVPQARALEDPVLVNTFWPIPDAALQTADGRAVNDLRLSQELPWPGKRSTRAAVADRETRIAATQLSQTRLEIEEAVHLAYYELWFADRAMAITEENRQIGAELVTLAEARNRAGGSQQDILRAQLQLDVIDNRLIELRQQKAVAQADLAALIQQPEMEDIEPSEKIEIADIPRRMDALIAAAEECSPRLQERLAAVSRERQEMRLATLGRYPDLMVGAGWMAMTTDDALSAVATGTDTVNFMVGLTLPIWRGRINASIREASAEVTAASREYDDAQNDVVRQLRRLKEQALAAQEQLRLYEERILPRTRQTLQLSSADYRGQLIGFGEVVDNFTELLMFELQAARSRATLAGTLAQIDRVVGCEIVIPGDASVAN